MDALWQHAVVTIIAAVALSVVVWPLLPASRTRRAASRGRPGCASCAAGAAACATPAGSTGDAAHQEDR